MENTLSAVLWDSFLSFIFYLTLLGDKFHPFELQLLI